MTFRTLYRRAIDPDVAITRRYRALRNAGEHYAWLTRTSFSSVFEELRLHHGLLVGSPNSPSVITAAANAINSARDRFLANLGSVTERRRRNKHSARRRPEPPYEAEFRPFVVLGQPRSRPATPVATAVPSTPASAHPPPAFDLGAIVHVRLNERNRTPRCGSIRQRVWHYNLGCWIYYLAVDGRKIHKRYLECDVYPAG